MANEEIKPGMVVWLKSGSPKMVVKYFTAQKLFLCTWFVDNEVKEHSFAAEQLTTVEPSK